MGSQTNRLPDMRPEPQRRFIPVQDYPVRPPVLSRHFLHDGEGPVGRAVIRKDDFNRPFIILPEYAPDGILMQLSSLCPVRIMLMEGSREEFMKKVQKRK